MRVTLIMGYMHHSRGRDLSDIDAKGRVRRALEDVNLSALLLSKCSPLSECSLLSAYSLVFLRLSVGIPECRLISNTYPQSSSKKLFSSSSFTFSNFRRSCSV